ncbi:TolC family outer membrane protein [Microbulbifer thermotolerans]|uniref:TolC family outer membrane protein n=1 Tax=Microbulbifer thermotolerans TaxID=252514 RepID=UPI00224895DE|nr:TolC family outer membrane protein [Microbulbifer thermotolerans]MCX2795316.1 TolC family outer membrane protein [Microbulbifer thermotolerans]
MKRSERNKTRGSHLRPLKNQIFAALKAPLAAALLGFGAVQAQADTLWEVYLQALENDPQLAADRAAYHAGLEAKNLGRSALLPQISASAEASRTRNNSTQFNYTFLDQGVLPVPNTTDSDTDERTYSATLSQAIFDLPAWFGYKRGAMASEQAAAEFSANQQEMMLRVATAYFNVLRAHDVLEAALAEEEALAKQLEQTQQRFEVGLTAITDVYDSQAAYDSSVARRLTAQDDLLSNFDALSVLTGSHHDTVAPLRGDFQVAPPEPIERAAWVDFALANNFDLKAARLAADAARYGARAAASEHLPTLTGSLTYQKYYQDGHADTSVPDADDIRLPIDTTTETKYAALTLSVPIYTGGGLSASRREARNLAFQAEDLRNLTQRNTVQNTRTLHRAVVTDVSRVKAREQAVVSAKSALDATQAGYEVGTRNIVDVLLAQRTLFQAQTDYANALYDYIINTLSLKRVAGLLAPDDLQQLEARLNPAQPVNRVAETSAVPAVK